MSHNVLIVDDEKNICFTFEKFLQQKNYQVETATSYDEAILKIDQSEFDLIFIDIILKGRSGIDLLKAIKQRNLNSSIVMITGVPTMETAMEAVRLGAFDYLPKPVLRDMLLRVAEVALRHKALIDEKEKYRINLEAIFNGVKDTIISVDKDLMVIETNQTASQMCGFASSQNIGTMQNSIEFPCQGECRQALIETVQSKKSVEFYHVACSCQSEGSRIVNLSAYPLINGRNQLSGGILVVRDDTRLANLEKKLRERQKFHGMVGISKEMQKIYSLIESLAEFRTTVLVTGESGTGKELVAEALHNKSSYSDQPFVTVNCAALAESLLESELFGHIKGAFSGAIKDRIGRFQMADGGTLFLDEIGEISPKIQVKLLRVLQNNEFERVGDSKPIKVNVRIVAATNKSLKEEVDAGNFRLDLYYRLKVVELHLPVLKKRREDIALLTDHFIEYYNKQFNKNVTGISGEAGDILNKYHWPGNIRELKHAIEHGFIYCRNHIILPEHLPSELNFFKKQTEGDIQRQKIIAALEKHHWNRTLTAKELNISRQYLYQKIKKLKIPVD